MLGTRDGDGILSAIGPIARGVTKTRAGLASLGRDLDHVIMGHWHQTLHLPDVTVVASLEGPDERSVKHLTAPAEDPSQALCSSATSTVPRSS